ncbi:MAG: glycosyltransferase family 39 protein [Opitutaceae bacterium]|jgi:4-amino-4-deoxy-L-arabinose transferase-like glycosyltransferase|nr:glycosyltransferase family 39 protein [Opitutaceae bacterium]
MLYQPEAKHIRGLVWLLIGGLFLGGLARRDWWYPDEPDVALPAIEMAARGDWVVPTQNGAIWLDYPPLAYWGARVTGLVTGGIGPFTARVPMLIFAVVLLLATARLGRRFGWGDDGGRMAATLLAGTPLIWQQATNVQVDLGYAAAQAVGLLCYLRGDAAEQGSKTNWGWRALGFAAFGVAILGKGPLGVLLPGLILTLWHGWNREWRPLWQLAPLALVSLAVALPWYVMLGQRIGWGVLGEEFYLQNFDRFQSTTRGHGGKGWWYYGKSLAVDFLPWVFLLVPAMYHGWKTQRADRNWRLLAIWILAPLVFFTVASTKRNVYLLPIYPALALMVANWLRASAGPWATRWRRGVGRGWSGFWFVIGLLILVLVVAGWGMGTSGWDPLRKYPGLMVSLRPGLIVLGLVMMNVGWWSGRSMPRDELKGWTTLALGGALIAGTAMHTVLPVIDEQRSYQPAAKWLGERTPAGETIGYFWPGREASKRPAWLCHLDGRRLEFFADDAAATAWLNQRPNRLLLTTPALATGLNSVVTAAEWRISSTSWVVLKAGE